MATGRCGCDRRHYDPPESCRWRIARSHLVIRSDDSDPTPQLFRRMYTCRASTRRHTAPLCPHMSAYVDPRRRRRRRRRRTGQARTQAKAWRPFVPTKAATQIRDPTIYRLLVCCFFLRLLAGFLIRSRIMVYPSD